jgi:hypothetical protein
MSFPIERYLVPEPSAIAPEGFTRIENTIRGGLPHTIRLNEQFKLILSMPTGLGITWRDADPQTVVSSSQDERRSSTLTPPLRLMVGVGKKRWSIIPLTASTRHQAVKPGAGLRLEIIILGWHITAGTVRGAGDYGSKIALVWRRAGEGSDQFSPPPIHPEVEKRQPQAQMMLARG